LQLTGKIKQYGRKSRMYKNICRATLLVKVIDLLTNRFTSGYCYYFFSFFFVTHLVLIQYQLIFAVL